MSAPPSAIGVTPRPHHPTNPRTVTIAYQGAPGAFGEIAALTHLHTSDPRPMPTFEQVVESVARGISDFGVIPVWNSVVGEIPWSRAAATMEGVERVAQIEIPIRLALLAAPGTSLSMVSYVGSHPAALAQCGRFLAAHPELVACPAWDTAGAARELGPEIGPKWYDRLPGATRKSVAAIAGPATANRYGLEVLVASVQDSVDAVTRFDLIAPRGGAR
jgi:prephenate dehydratase